MGRCGGGRSTWRWKAGVRRQQGGGGYGTHCVLLALRLDVASSTRPPRPAARCGGGSATVSSSSAIERNVLADVGRHWKERDDVAVEGACVAVEGRCGGGRPTRGQKVVLPGNYSEYGRSLRCGRLACVELARLNQGLIALSWWGLLALLPGGDY